MNIFSTICRAAMISSLLLNAIFISNVFAQEAGESGIPGKKINISHINMMFDNIKKNTNWNTSADLRWTYYFSHNEPSQLEKAKAILVNKGYNFVDLNLSDDEDVSPIGSYYLQIDKIETHSPTSLDKRNNEFYILANELGLDSYEGMDAGSADELAY
jgi:hypothetical protein